jgi:hypothetical protein
MDIFSPQVVRQQRRCGAESGGVISFLSIATDVEKKLLSIKRVRSIPVVDVGSDVQRHGFGNGDAGISLKPRLARSQHTDATTDNDCWFATEISPVRTTAWLTRTLVTQRILNRDSAQILL